MFVNGNPRAIGTLCGGGLFWCF